MPGGRFDHGAELDDFKQTTLATNTNTMIVNRTGTFPLDYDGNDQENGGKENQPQN